jgi:hypothetical protein
MLNTNEAAKLLKTIQPYVGPIREAILGGFRYRHQRYAEELVNHSTRTRACLTNDLIVEHAKRALLPLGVRVFKVHNRVLFELPGGIIIHFKKLDKQLQTSNYPTLFSEQFYKQDDLPGIPKLLRLVAGFTTKDWVGIDGIYITLPSGTEIEWSMSLDMEPENLIQPIPTPQEKPNAQPRRTKRVRRKGGDERREGTGTDG